MMTIEFNNKYEFHTMEYNLDYLQMFKDRGVEIIYRNKKYLFTFDEDSTPRVDGILLSTILEKYNDNRKVPLYAFMQIYAGFMVEIQNSMIDCFEYHDLFSQFRPVQQKEETLHELKPMTLLFTYYCVYTDKDPNVAYDKNFQQQYLDLVERFLKYIGFNFEKVDMVPCEIKKGEDLHALVSIDWFEPFESTLDNDVYVPIMIIEKEQNKKVIDFKTTYSHVERIVGFYDFMGLDKTHPATEFPRIKNVIKDII